MSRFVFNIGQRVHEQQGAGGQEETRRAREILALSMFLDAVREGEHKQQLGARPRPHHRTSDPGPPGPLSTPQLRVRLLAAVIGRAGDRAEWLVPAAWRPAAPYAASVD